MVAQRALGGASPTDRSPFTFHGIAQSPMRTSRTSLSITVRIAPGPAVAGRHSRRKPFRQLAAQDVFHFPGRLGQLDLEVVVASPRFGATRLEPEQPQHPSFVRQAATATELVSKLNVMDGESQRRRLRS